MPSKRKHEGGEANVAGAAEKAERLEILFSVHVWLNSKVNLGSFNLINVTRTKSAFFSKTSMRKTGLTFLSLKTTIEFRQVVVDF